MQNRTGNQAKSTAYFDQGKTNSTSGRGANRQGKPTNVVTGDVIVVNSDSDDEYPTGPAINHPRRANKTVVSDTEDEDLEDESPKAPMVHGTRRVPRAVIPDIEDEDEDLEHDSPKALLVSGTIDASTMITPSETVGTGSSFQIAPTDQDAARGVVEILDESPTARAGSGIPDVDKTAVLNQSSRTTQSVRSGVWEAPGDGSCFFHAMNWAIFRRELDMTAHLRADVARIV